MIVFLNGSFVPEAKAVVSAFDRGYLYGDGLFETMRVVKGSPFRWEQHWQRLRAGAAFIGMKPNYSQAQLRKFADRLITRNKLPDSLLRITISRGVGPRGYSPKGANDPTTVMTIHPAPPKEPDSLPQWRLVTASTRLPAGEALAQFKTCNKLSQVLARGEADAARADEALLLNTRGFVVEGASSNLFWIQKSTICTPPLISGVLAGVTRAVVAELCAKLNLRLQEAQVRPAQLGKAQGVFVSLSSFGIAEGISLNGQKLRRSPLTRILSSAYWEMVFRESGVP